MEIEIYNPILKYRVSSNDLGDVYNIPHDCGLNIDLDVIMKTFIHCELKVKQEYTEVIVIHKGALKRSLK